MVLVIAKPAVLYSTKSMKIRNIFFWEFSAKITNKIKSIVKHLVTKCI